MARCVTHLELDRAETEPLPICQVVVRQGLGTDAQPEHGRLSRRRTVEIEIRGVQVDRACVPVHQLAHRCDVVQVSVGKENRRRFHAPVVQRVDDPAGIVTRIDHQRGLRIARMTDEMAVRLKRADGQGPNLQPAGRGGGAQTEKEVPQPQDPVAFGLSNVNPEPLKLL